MPRLQRGLPVLVAWALLVWAPAIGLEVRALLVAPAAPSSSPRALLFAGPAFALDGRALLASSAKMTEPAGWSDRRALLTIESYAHGDEMRERRVELKESLGEDLEVAALTEFLGPADVLGLRVLDHWGPDRHGDVYVWTPATRRFQKVPSGQSDDTPGYGNEPGYRDAQLLDVLPRMAADVEVEVVHEETIDGAPTAVLDVDVGERRWPMGRRFRVWVSTADGLLRRIEARAADGTVSRRVTVLAWAPADGRTTATRVAVETPAAERKTVFVRSEVEYDRGIPARAFSLRDLSKGR